MRILQRLALNKRAKRKSDEAKTRRKLFKLQKGKVYKLTIFYSL